MSKIKSLFWVNGLLLVLLGAFLFSHPETAFRLAVVIFSLEMIISGMVAVFFSWTARTYSYRGLLFFWSLFQVFLWLLLLMFPSISEFLVKVIVVWIWVIIIIGGVSQLLRSFQSRELHTSVWWLQFGLGVLSLLFGSFLVTNAFFSFLILNVLLGMGIISAGIWIFIFWFYIKESKEVISIEIRG